MSEVLNRRKDGSSLDLESASFSEFALSSGRFTEDVLAIVAGNDGLGVAEDDSSLVAASALDVHEVGVGVLHQALELVLALLVFGSGVQKVFSELKKKSIYYYQSK